MTTPNIDVARDRLNRSIDNTRKLRQRISRSAGELRGDVEEPAEVSPIVEQEPAGIDVVGNGGSRN